MAWSASFPQAMSRRSPASELQEAGLPGFLAGGTPISTAPTRLLTSLPSLDTTPPATTNEAQLERLTVAASTAASSDNR